MIKNKKIFIFIILVFWLFSCWETDEDKWLSLKVLDNFEVSVPASWVVLDSWDSSMLPDPSYWKISLVVSSSEPKDGFSNNLLILEDKLEKDITSKDFSVFTNLWARNDYYSYHEIETKDFSFIDWEESKLYVFEARYNESTPNLKFIQTAHICDDKSYLLTIALSSSIEDTSKYEYILQTFNCRGEEGSDTESDEEEEEKEE